MNISTNEQSVKVGDIASDFTFTLNGQTVHLRDFRGKQAVVLYFYPLHHSAKHSSDSLL